MISNKKNYLLTLFSGFGGVIFTILLNLVTIPVSLSYWKADRYGIWVLLTSILLYLGMTNLGLNTSASVLMAKNPRVSDKIKILKRSFLILLISVGVITIGFLILNVCTKNWINLIGKIPANLFEETLSASFVLVIFYLLSLPFSLLSAVYTGFQRAYIENVFNILLNVLNFLVLIIVIILRGNLVLYAFLWGIALVIFNVAKYLFFYFTIYKKLSDEKDDIIISSNPDTGYRIIFITGIRFFFVGIASTLVWNTDTLVISNFINIQSVTPYFITFKLFSVIFGVIFQINNSIMPLVAKEYGSNNWDWINKIYSNMVVLLSILGGAFWIGGILFFKDIITLWTGPGNYAGLLIVIFFGGYSYLLCMVNLNAGIINTFNYTSIAPYTSWGEALIKIIVSVILVKVIGIAGVAIGTLLGSLLIPTWILPIWIKKRSEGRLHYYFPFIRNHFVLVIVPVVILSVLSQLYISQILVLRLIGLAIFSIYFLMSYISMPSTNRIFFLDNIKVIFNRIGLSSPIANRLNGEDQISTIRNPDTNF
jgi:O-antigen/teichoic acid export membrane protein